LGLGLAFLMEVMRQSAIMASAARPSAPTRGAVRHPATTAAPAEVPDLDIAMPQFDFTAAVAPQTAVAETVPKVVATWPSAPPMAMAFGELDSIAGQDLPGEPLSRVSAAMLEAAAASGSKTFCVASIGGSFDSAYFSVALARYLAASKVKTVVVDLVSSRPSSMDLMGLPEGPGLGELVMGRADVAKIILRDPKSAAQHIRFGLQPETGVRGILTPRMAAVINSLAQVYDAIILNGGEASSATPDMLQGVGSVLFLAPQSRHRDASAAARSLAAKGIRQALFVKLEPRETLSSDLRAAG
jgi:Mrp family chromosome partitioning ATPase